MVWEAVNQNLPGFVVMTELAAPQAGSTNWNNGFLPAYYPRHQTSLTRFADP